MSKPSAMSFRFRDVPQSVLYAIVEKINKTDATAAFHYSSGVFELTALNGEDMARAIEILTTFPHFGDKFEPPPKEKEELKSGESLFA